MKTTPGPGLSLAAGALLAAFAAAPAMAENCETIHLGAALSLTGKYAAEGVRIKDGYEYAVQKIDEAGGIRIAARCHTFEIVYYDDASKPARSETLAERLIDRNGIRYMLGPYSSGMTRAIALVTEQHGVPMVEAAGASSSLFNNGHRYLFAVLSTAEQHLASAIDLAAEQAVKDGRAPGDLRVAVVAASDASSLNTRSGVAAAAKRHGMDIVLDERLSDDPDNMDAIMAGVAEAKPDLLVVSSYMVSAETVARRIGAYDLAIPMIALDNCEEEGRTEMPGGQAGGILCSTQWAGTLDYTDPVFGSANGFAAGFREAFPEYEGEPVTPIIAQAAAAVYVFKDAFERAASLDPDAVRDALVETDLRTFYGPVRFSENGNNIAKPMVLRQIREGGYAVVAPSGVAPDPLEWPRRPREAR